MVNPVDLTVSGWDISGLNLYEACERAHVLEPSLLSQLKDDLKAIVPLKAVLNPDYIAANQDERVDNVVKGTNLELIAKIRQDIQNMKKKCDKVIVLWTANTEMNLYPEIQNIDDLQNRINANEPLPSSVLYCIAAIEEQTLYLNGSP